MNNNTPHSSIPKQEVVNEEDELKAFRNANGGMFPYQFDENVKSLFKAVMETGKQGTYTVTLTATPNQKTDTATLSVKHKLKLPELPQKETLFFIGRDGDYQRQDFKQPRLFTSEDARLAG